MDYIIREFRTEDCESIWRLNTYEMGYDYPIEDTREKLSALIRSDEHKIFVAVCCDEVIGYVHANNYDLIYASHMKNIMGIAVAEHMKRKGVGRALLEAVENWARETNAEGVRLVSGESRRDAHKFYHRCGYSGDKMQINMVKKI
ncbi:MAG: GNAT family N-acetyltransferase [Oscillospiraceae bacterium]|nr:GNAT family N-acetyltransferase [Oscillospiraceae bacterium]